MTSTGFTTVELSVLTIDSFEELDPTTNKIVTRTARRIAAKGFEVLDILHIFSTVKSFPWGRSSSAKERVHQYEIRFLNEADEEFCLYVRETQVVSIDKCNPYDRKPPSTKPGVEFLTTDRITRKVLGMPEPEAL